MIKYKQPSAARLRFYGLTAEQHRELWGEGICPICLKPYQASGIRTAVIDHDHHMFTTRGVICSGDNYWLGTMHDDGDKLLRAANYLITPPTSLWVPPPRLLDAPPLLP